MESFWAPGGEVKSVISADGKVFADRKDFFKGWGLNWDVPSEMKPVLELVDEIEDTVHQRVSTAFQVFRGLALAAERVHRANIPALYASAKSAVRSGSKTTRMVKVLEVNALIEAFCKQRHVRPSAAKRFWFYAPFGKKKTGELTDAELSTAIENITDFLAR